MKTLINNLIVFIFINACNYAFWSLVCWDYNPGEWGWFARFLATIILITSFGVVKYKRRKAKNLKAKSEIFLLK